MMKKTLRVTLEIEVSDLPDERRIELASMAQEDVDNMPDITCTSASELAWTLAEGIPTEGHNELFFEGSDIFVEFTHAKVVSADYV